MLQDTAQICYRFVERLPSAIGSRDKCEQLWMTDKLLNRNFFKIAWHMSLLPSRYCRLIRTTLLRDAHWQFGLAIFIIQSQKLIRDRCEILQTP